MEPVLQVKHIAKEFPGVKALEDISIDFYPGECHALVGENGAGKSTLIKIIASIYKPTKGEVYLEGKECNFKTPKDAIDAGIAVIQQETSIAPHLSIAENMYLGCEPKLPNGLLDRRKMEKDAQAVLDEMGLELDSHTICNGLTAAQLQMVEIAKVISKHAKVVVLDEPTSSLSEKEIDSLFEQVRKMKEAKTTMIYVTHRMAELPIICERCSIFRDGYKVAEYMVKDVDEQTIVNSMVGRELGAYVKPEHTPKEELLRVENLTQEGTFENVSFHINAGEIVAFSGLVGAGRTEVMEAIFGATNITSGKVYLFGEEVHFKHPAEAIAKKMGLATEDRRRTGLLLAKSIQENIGLPNLPFHARKFLMNLVNVKWEKDTSEEYMEKLKIKAPNIAVLCGNLSGGNQQKVILSKWLAAGVRVLILDEPTKGIDVNARAEFYALMNDFVEQGGGIVMVSSDMPEIIKVADRAYVMSEGHLTGELKREDINELNLISLASPVSDGSDRKAEDTTTVSQ
ncbi:MAG: sugar ABC transporter ATP-binding protein [Lachnospiraceae bacterium]|nr:sugar ABC transporter ATP-binding protein [Lachnospiraceae bacterium]